MLITLTTPKDIYFIKYLVDQGNMRKNKSYRTCDWGDAHMGRMR